MADLTGFDARTIEPSAPMGPVPAGDYLAKITETEKRPTKSGNGDLLALKLEICDGDHAGRKMRYFLNLWNANDTAREIAQRDLSAICHAVGVLEPKDSNQLCNIPMTIKVAVLDPNAEGKVYNEIKGFSKRQAAAAPQAAASTNGGWMG